MSNDAFTEIISGLSEGEQVVIVTTASNQPLAGGTFGNGTTGAGGGFPGMGGGSGFVTR
jgi:hypothetical protein